MAAYRIPSDVIVEILVGLPVISLQRFKSVCKDWYTLINSPLFIQLHLNKSLLFNFPHNHTVFYTNDDSLCVVDDIYRPSKPIKVYWPKDIITSSESLIYTIGSCNGLVCLCVTSRSVLERNVLCFLICNPSTRTFKFKPTFPFLELQHLMSGALSYGFGYDSKHDDYKIVVTRKDLKKNARDDVYIYSFKADSWKCSTHIPIEGSTQFYSRIKLDDVVCANNMLHYIVYSLVDENDNDPNYRIVRFDLSSETWTDDLSFPAGVMDWTYVELGVLDNCLFLRLGERNHPLNVWITKGYNRDEDSWSIKYNIPEKFNNFTLIAASKEGPLRLLFVRRYGVYGSVHKLLWYNPDDTTTESVELERSSSDSLFHLCITSLVTIPGSSFNLEHPGNV